MRIFVLIIALLSILFWTSTPDSKEILVFASDRSGSSNLYISDSNGKNLKQITFGSTPKWSPRVINRNEVSFLQQDGDDVVRRKLNLKTGVIKRLNQPTFCKLDDKNAQISPNGKHLLFQCGNDVFVSNLRMRKSVNLTNSTGAKNFKPAWFPDSKTIAFSTDRDGNQEIYQIGIDGKGLKNLTNSPGNDEAPAISPDGKKMLFSSGRDGKRNREIYLLNLSSGIARNMTATPDWELIAHWGNDSKTFYFGSNRDGNWEIYRSDIENKNPIRITNNPAFDGDPRVLPLK